MMPDKLVKPFFLTKSAVFLVSLFIILLDQLSKFLIQSYFVSELTFPVIRGVFHITLTFNKGAAFGIFKGGTPIFIFISFFCIFVIILLLKRSVLLEKFLGFDSDHLSVRLAFGLILGGACGNLIDRLRYGYVVDFLDFRRWPVFNIADSAITVGGVILFLALFKDKRKDGS